MRRHDRQSQGVLTKHYNASQRRIDSWDQLKDAARRLADASGAGGEQRGGARNGA